MLNYVIRRVLYAIPILVGVSLLTFVLFYATVSPEQMARSKLSSKNPTQQQINDWLKQHDYDKPRIAQFKKHMTELLLFRFGPSAVVASMSFFAVVILSISLALAVAYYRGTYIDTWATILCVILMSITILVYLIAGQYLFGKVLKYAPLAGYRPGWDAVRFAILPLIIAILGSIGGNVRFYRTIMLEEMNQDYVRTARAKGASERGVLFQHILKNASAPILTSVVLTIPFLLLGSLLTESFFGIPGLGTVTVDAITNQDFAVVRTMVFLGTILYIIGSVLTDISYALVDPRVRLE
jgi:peptide/nickel transport system permease protein